MLQNGLREAPGKEGFQGNASRTEKEKDADPGYGVNRFSLRDLGPVSLEGGGSQETQHRPWLPISQWLKVASGTLLPGISVLS